jgi:hypothetical protein
LASEVLTAGTYRQGRALRVFEKKSPHLRFAPGSIFFQKALPLSPACSGELLNKKPPEAPAEGG